jgi:hypothetical protein
MNGEGIVFLFVVTAYCVAGLVDLALLPFRPLLPKTFYVGTAVVQAARVDPRARPTALGHYLIQAPTGADWYRITPPDVPSEAPQVGPGFGPKLALFREARLLFVRKPTSHKPLALRGLDRALEPSPAPMRGRMEPAAFVRVDRLDPSTGNLQAQLSAVIERSRAAPNGSSLEDVEQGRYQAARAERSFTTIEGLPCVRDEFVFLYLDDPSHRSKASRHVAHAMVCADPACPGQAISLLLRATGSQTGAVEREAGAFLEGLRIDRTATPACAALATAVPTEVRRP